jgi:RNA:NAD 2'-phosphotransferase (TPT1/KptA family)
MIVYHGTTRRRAERILVSGFLARKPSRRVWFARSRAYAEGRAKTQARRAHDRPAVLVCELDLQAYRRPIRERPARWRCWTATARPAAPAP